eukprot:2874325-Alexandrium_andersonii.AAC.1
MRAPAVIPVCPAAPAPTPGVDDPLAGGEGVRGEVGQAGEVLVDTGGPDPSAPPRRDSQAALGDQARTPVSYTHLRAHETSAHL